MNYIQNNTKFSINRWYDNKISASDVIVAYKGNITSDIITNLLSEIENKIEKLDINPKGIKLIYNVMVEVLQNLFHHSMEDIFDNNSHEKWAAFILYKTNDKISLSTGNFIENRSIINLKGKIDFINSLTKEEVKEYYVRILNNEQYSAKGGGGLGLIDIIKKTNSKYEYYFYDINDDYSFYNLNINIL